MKSDAQCRNPSGHVHGRNCPALDYIVRGRVGAVEITKLFDTSLLGETAQTWLPDFDRQRVEAHEHWLAPNHYDPESGRIFMPVHSWIVRTDKHTILIDSCVGNHKERPGIPEMHQLNTHYLKRMKSLGVDPEDIDFVMCSHLHADHTGWNTKLVNGTWVPTFPNAKYVMSQIEHDHAERLAHGNVPGVPAWFTHMYNDSVLPIIEAGQAVLFDDTFALDDTFIMRHAPGHSAGHVRIELSSNGEHGVFCGDILHSPIQIPFWQWSSRVCENPTQAAKSRHDLLSFCVENNALLLPGHFEDPYIGRIVDDAGTFGIRFGW
ncbi:MBL fold metallo-hydrolase [Pseudomonas sp. 18058]|uniref:MBL fold metallo-hydrolase n=1 Tax=Pseudomonas sp. 18058 TaxID=2681406 RepID=UPI00135BDBC1|nr:MBL fold metallo-hydrolase [Pseudomonas sp. 18058]